MTFSTYLTRLSAHMAAELKETQCLQRAAALAYTTILSLVPVIALFVLYFKMAGKLDAFNINIQGWIVRTFVAESAQGAAGYLNKFVANLHTKTLGTFGAAGLVFTAYSLLRTVEVSFNTAWKVRTHRSIWARFQMLCSLLVVVPAALAVSFYLSGKVQQMKFFHQYSDLTSVTRAFFMGAPFLLTSFSLFFVFKLVPNTPVRFRSAAAAALVSGILFEWAKMGFNLYVARVIPISKIYGSAGLIPVFLLWIYLSWVIVLSGVTLSYTIQNLRHLHRKHLEKKAANPLALAVHEEWGLRIARALAARFARGEGPQLSVTLAGDVSLPTSAVEDHLEVLRKAGLLLWVEEENRAGFLFSRPAEKLSENDVISVFRAQLALPQLENPAAVPLLELS